MAVTRPASKRSRRRSSRALRSRGRRSEVSTSWLPRSCRALKVWKNSSSVLALRREELDVVDEQHVGVAVAALEALHVLAVQRGEELVGERLDRRVADGQPAAVGEDVVADRVQQVGLADAGGPVDEERVVGVAGKLGHGERGGVGEAIGVADDELLEREAGVDPMVRGDGLRGRCGRTGARRSRPPGRCVAHAPRRSPGGRGRRRRRPAARARSARRPTRGARAAPRRRGRRPRGRRRAAGRARGRTCQPGPPRAARPGWRSRCGRGPRSRQGKSAPRRAAFGGEMGEEAALGATGAATIATGSGPDARPVGRLRTHVANREQNRRASCAHACARRVHESVDGVRTLDWRAGHSIVPSP